MLENLIEVHNTLCEISVKGEDSIRMAKCLVILRDIVNTLQKEQEEQHNGIQQTISTDNREQDTSVLSGQD